VVDQHGRPPRPPGHQAEEGSGDVHARASRHRTDVAVYRRFVVLLKPSWFPLAVALAASACTPLLFAARIWLLKVLIDTVLRGHRPDLLVAVAGGFVVIAVARSVLTFVEDKLSGTVGTRVVRDLRVTVYTHLQGLSLRYFHRHRLGDLLTRLSGDIAAIEDLLVTGLSTILSHLVTIVLFTSLLIVLDPHLVLVAAGVLPVLVVTTIIDARLGRRAQRGIRERTSELTSTAEEGLSAIALVKSFARSGHESARFATAAQASATARLRAVGLRAVVTPLTELVGAVGTAVVVYLGAQQVMAGTLSLGSLVIFIKLPGVAVHPDPGIEPLGGHPATRPGRRRAGGGHPRRPHRPGRAGRGAPAAGGARTPRPGPRHLRLRPRGPCSARRQFHRGPW